ncbi:C_GCAxxG_C_C family protein [Anaerotignum lactatifermentans]|uniref:C_GCAxxG_C_C family protein n=1 Tax=Anaerotignum lactatifermentans TaxID=160404 RepID=A0ABS2GAN0_9FIRM|nr:C-GCAxxG-C-C family protein [Anaerotignum lactatifermentans]MBM6829833.1 C_GCAxxG_C_C family protein [Anaerotignum lactatifermentans]MBM6878227.1 C_GCAxxG_C_C family protein [Anaerotignum lactatifermentans]MBM6951307.1 C_GCAxxG_C_C family protein [Anaerotignum lactatifermentans]
MTDRISRVEENHKKGYNCAQAVACAYCDLLGVEEKDAFRAVECFGRGMGVMGTCGAVSAMAYLVGLKLSDVNLEHPKTKLDCYNTIQTMTDDFKKKNQTIICRELKGMDTGVMLRSCSGCMADAAEIVEKYLFAEK